ncbi:hypothetical protein GCM10022285_18230 [Streptomyces tunisiensis]|uniref:Uncharacterized protein n=1 Tax=Streptomyces tunisiensis TaxID=948699 RepID=A0ABP7Y384_9ACTN
MVDTVVVGRRRAGGRAAAERLHALRAAGRRQLAAGAFHRLGLTTDDHTRKPALDTYKGLIARHGRGDAHQSVALLLHPQRQCNTLP